MVLVRRCEGEVLSVSGLGVNRVFSRVLWCCRNEQVSRGLLFSFGSINSLAGSAS